MAENPVPFTHAKQVGFNLKDVILNTNNEVALFYPEHSNKEVFICVSDFISKCCIRKAFTRSLIQYKECLSEFWYSAKAIDNSKVSFSILAGRIYRVLGLNTFRKAIRAHYLSHSSDYVDPPSIDINPVAFKAPIYSSQTEKKVSQGTNPRAKVGHKKQSTSSKQPSMSSGEATKGRSSKAPTAGGLTSLGVTSEEGAHLQLSSGMSAFSKLKHTYSASQGKDEGIKNNSLDHTFAGTDPNVLADKTKYISDELETILVTPKTGTKNAAKPSEEIKFGEIKLEDLAKLVPNFKADLKDPDSPEDDPIIVVDDSEEDEEEDKNEEIYSTTNDKREDILASIPPSSRSIHIQELTKQVLLLQSQKHTLETEKKKAEAGIARLKAQHPSPNVGQLNKLLIKSLTAEFLKILSAHDFYSSLPTELKEVPSN
uniref:Uncharacterized protein n=1 Tax=Tanacetum cinerariifolium TaxID=118510 RepID=A0A6L2K915_TANCI|nr:hypothetical protein [Tanacetum cinerariifolium]